MKLTIFFLLKALLGIASCDWMCMQFKKESCNRVKILDISDPFCSSNDERVECIRSAAHECGVESSTIVQEVIEGYSEACREGTEMNHLYKKHKACIFLETVEGNNVCSRIGMQEADTLGFPSLTRTYLEKVLKLACKYHDSGNKCVDDNVNSTCGAEAAKFRHQLSHPSIRLSKHVCVEFGFEIEPELASTVHPREYPEHKSGADINESLQLIYVLVAAFCTKWFSRY